MGTLDAQAIFFLPRQELVVWGVDTLLIAHSDMGQGKLSETSIHCTGLMSLVLFLVVA